MANLETAAGSPATSPSARCLPETSKTERLAARQEGPEGLKTYGVNRVWDATNRTGNFEAAGGRLSDCSRGNIPGSAGGGLPLSQP